MIRVNIHVCVYAEGVTVMVRAICVDCFVRSCDTPFTLGTIHDPTLSIIGITAIIHVPKRMIRIHVCGLMECIDRLVRVLGRVQREASTVLHAQRIRQTRK